MNTKQKAKKYKTRSGKRQKPQKMGTKKIEMTQRRAGSNGRPRKKRRKSFVLHQDEVGRTYFESVDAPGKTTWTLPSDAIVEDVTAFSPIAAIKRLEETSPTPKKTLHASAGSNGRPQKKRGKSFVLHKDKVGRTYYESVDAPGETTWTLPSDAILEDVTSFSPIAAIKRLEEV